MFQKPIYHVNTEEMTQVMSNYHHPDVLLERILQNEISNTQCITVISGDGLSFNIPLFLVHSAIPLISLSIIGASHTETIAISLPDFHPSSLACLRELLTKGTSNITEKHSTLIIPDMVHFLGNSINVEKLSGLEFPSNADFNSTFESPDNTTPFVDMLEDEEFDIVTTRPMTDNLISLKNNRCSRHCANSCESILTTWSADDLEFIRNLFDFEKINTTKTKLLEHLKSQVKFGFQADSYRVKNQVFCINFFSFITGCSEYILKSVLCDFREGRELYCHGNLGAVRPESVATIKAICWLKIFSECYGQFRWLLI